MLAEIEAALGNAKEALAKIDEALALAKKMEERQSDVYLHRIRAEILLKVDPANAEMAEDSFSPPSGSRNNKKVRTDQLLAALPLGEALSIDGRVRCTGPRVLCSRARRLRAMPDLPQIEEAQGLSAHPRRPDEVRGVVAAREQRLKLQTAYGLAVAWSRGFAAEETKVAFAGARELGAGSTAWTSNSLILTDNSITNLTSGELGLAREAAETSPRVAGRQAECRKPWPGSATWV